MSAHSAGETSITLNDGTVWQVAATRSTQAPTRSVNVHLRTRYVNQTSYERISRGSLMDGGCNGGVAGDDMYVLERTGHTVDVRGIDDHIVEGLDVGTAVGLVTTVAGEKLLLYCHQYALAGKGPTVHSTHQIRHFGHTVDDTATVSGGSQCLITCIGGYVIPFAFRDGLPCMDMRKPTVQELTMYPSVMLTSDVLWDPKVLDNEFHSEVSNLPLRDVDRGHIDPRVGDDGLQTDYPRARVSAASARSQ